MTNLVASDKDVKLISDYGPRRSGKRTRVHRGLDIKAPKGTAVLAYDKGKVEVAGRRRGYGLSVDVRHADGTVSRYAHMSNIAVKVGQVVQSGTPVGAVGQTGRATTAHLHFEMLRNGKAVNPTPYLKNGFAMVLSTDAPARALANVGKASNSGSQKVVKKKRQTKRSQPPKATNKSKNKKATASKARTTASKNVQKTRSPQPTRITAQASAPTTSRVKATAQTRKNAPQTAQKAPQKTTQKNASKSASATASKSTSKSDSKTASKTASKSGQATASAAKKSSSSAPRAATSATHSR